MQSVAPCPLISAGAGFYPVPRAHLCERSACFIFFYQKAHFTAPLRPAKSPGSVSSSLASWSIFLRTKNSYFPSSWSCCFLTVETSIETAGSFDSRRVWGTGVHAGSLSWHSTNPSKSLGLFPKPSPAIFRVQHAALTQYTQQRGFPISACLSLIFHTSVLLFHLLFETNS